MTYLLILVATIILSLVHTNKSVKHSKRMMLHNMLSEGKITPETYKEYINKVKND